MDKYEIDIYDNLFLSIVVTDGFASPNSQKGDYFTLSVLGIELPWILEKHFPKSIQSQVTKRKRISGFFADFKK